MIDLGLLGKCCPGKKIYQVWSSGVTTIICRLMRHMIKAYRKQSSQTSNPKNTRRLIYPSLISVWISQRNCERVTFRRWRKTTSIGAFFSFMSVILAIIMITSELNQQSTIKFVNTSMHGVSDSFAMQAFAIFGFRPYVPVTEQQLPDPEFPTVRFPNPEENGK